MIDATLRLRMAMEALTYACAVIYADDLGPEQMKTWRPKQLMDRILEVDPQADQAATLSFGIEPSYGKQPETMTILGTDQPLNLATLKKHYDALGSYLHTPTLGQLENNKSHDMQKLRTRCEKIVETIQEVLSSPVSGTVFSTSCTFECVGCKTTITRGLSPSIQSRMIECWECMATYNLRRHSDEDVRVQPRWSVFACVADNCETENFLWEKQVSPDFKWECRECGTPQKLNYCLVALNSPQEQNH